MSSHLIRQLEVHAAQHPDAVAVHEVGGRTVSRRQLMNMAHRAACRLHHALPPEAAVMTALSNRVEAMAIFLGAMWADRMIFPVNPELTASELGGLVDQAPVAMAVAESPATEALGRHVPVHDPEALTTTGEPEPIEHRGRGAVLLQSSGTTGLPKIVCRDAPSLDADGRHCAQVVGMTAVDSMFVCIPLYHSYAIDHAVLGATMAGASLSLCRGFDLATTQDVLSNAAVTLLPGVPFMFEALAHAAPEGGARTALRRAYSAGGPLPRGVADAFEKAYGVRAGQIYGATEFGSVTYNDPEIEPYDPTCVGRPLPGVRLRILDVDDPDPARPLAPDEEGHVAVAAPSMLACYLGQADPPTQDGFMLSGDLGRLDAHGRLHLTGRVKLLVDVGGLKVNLMEVESVLARHPSVEKVVVVPMPVTETSCRLKAVVQMRREAPADVESLRRFAREHLIQYKVPRVFELCDALPCSPTGKVLRQAVACP